MRTQSVADATRAGGAGGVAGAVGGVAALGILAVFALREATRAEPEELTPEAMSSPPSGSRTGACSCGGARSGRKDR